MLKQLAPSAVMPPSPKRPAWMTSAIDTAITAAHGPKMMAMSTAPTAWPVEPPITGTLNIMSTKEKADPRAKSGTCRARSVRLTLRAAMTQMGTIKRSRTA